MARFISSREPPRYGSAPLMRLIILYLFYFLITRQLPPEKCSGYHNGNYSFSWFRQLVPWPPPWFAPCFPLVPGRCPFILTFYQYNRTTNRSCHRRPGAAYSWPLVPFAMRFSISRFICASCCAGDQWRPVSYSSAAASFLLI